MRSLVSIALGFAALALLPASAQAEDKAELVAERIHSKLPLYSFDWPELWPQNFYSEDSFGCRTRVAWGDWRFVPADGETGEESWERYTNYGVFHCAAILRAADTQAELAEAEWEYGFFVLLGKARLGAKPWEIWALQKGTVPGSDYVLLAREPKAEAIRGFRVLQRRCPRGRILETSLDIWTTRYCAIDSRAELLALGRRMLLLPPLGTISWAAEIPEAPEDD